TWCHGSGRAAPSSRRTDTSRRWSACWATSASGATRSVSSRRASGAWDGGSFWRSRRPDASTGLPRARRLRASLLLAQLDAADLAAHGLRQAFHELDLARVLVR